MRGSESGRGRMEKMVCCIMTRSRSLTFIKTYTVDTRLQEVVRVDGRQDEQEMRRWERREAGESDRGQTCALVATTAGPPDEVITYRG